MCRDSIAIANSTWIASFVSPEELFLFIKACEKLHCYRVADISSITFSRIELSIQGTVQAQFLMDHGT